MNNPYPPPQTELKTNKRSRSYLPIVFGIVSIILGVYFSFSLLAALLVSIKSLELLIRGGISEGQIVWIVVIIITIIRILLSIWAVFIGFKLCTYLDIGRRHFNYYTLIVIALSLFSFLFTLFTSNVELTNLFNKVPELTLTSILDFIYLFLEPIVLIYVALIMNRKNVRDSLSK